MTTFDILAVMEAIPSIVCDTLYSLGLHDQTPSWKIMDNKGRITVVLHWEPEEVAALRGTTLPAIAGPSRQSSTCSTIASGGPRLLGIHARSISQVIPNFLSYLSIRSKDYKGSVSHQVRLVYLRREPTYLSCIFLNSKE